MGDPRWVLARLRAVAARPWLSWLLTRVVALALGGLCVALVRGNVFFDTTYYAGWAHGTLSGTRIPYRDFPWEYPPAALPALLLPGLPAALAPHHYDVVYGTLWVAFMLVVDGGVLRLLLRHDKAAGRTAATTVWLYGLPLLGALSWARYDLLPAAAALVAVLSAGSGQAGRAGRAAGLGAALKLWPALLAPVQRTRRTTVLASASAAAVVLASAGVTWLLTGDLGFGQVLHYQAQRGLQVESLPALPLEWLRHLRVGGYADSFRFGAHEIVGPWVGPLAHATTGLYLLGLLALGVGHWRVLRRDVGPEQIALTAMSFLMLTLVTDKVLSPQYVLWLLAVLAGACLLDPSAWRPYVPWVLLTCGLTALVFPWYYGDVLGTGLPGLVIMTLRDLVLLGMAAAVAHRLVRELRAATKLPEARFDDDLAAALP